MEYTFNGMQCQTQIPSSAFHVEETAVVNNRDMTAAGTPILESMPYQNFPDQSRPLQHRAMSASHAAMLASSMHDGDDIFYHG